ncbi:MAG: Xaa-Pro peptidase family protein [Acidobacteriota bacterium]
MNRTLSIAALTVTLLGVAAVDAQRFTYPPEEFQERRETLCEAVRKDSGDAPALIALFARTKAQTAMRFRQDHDFFYVTGNSNSNAALLIDANNCDSWLFLVTQTAREASRDGWNWLYQDGAAETHGFREIRPLSYFEEFLARRRISGQQSLYVRLSERDDMDHSRSDTAIYTARRMVNPWGAQPTEDAWRVTQWRERYPYYQLSDISPVIDRLRMIKRPLEKDALRRGGQVSAAAIQAAIEVTRPGGWEYELEAEASYVLDKNGAEHHAYAAIVGSGPNGNVWHYNDNGARLEEGELIVMDYGGSFGYQTMDITRTWPVSGSFDELQERAYRATLEAQKAIIAAMKPGATRAQTREICRRIYDKWGFEDQPAYGAGHFVGMAVHDVGDYDAPFEPGMVIAVEPIIEITEHNLHIRIEDTVLITEDEPEILSAEVPKELEDVAALVGKRAGK